MKKQSKGSFLFYLCYALLILGYIAGMFWMRSWLNDQLVAFETATQPNVKSEEVFQTYFAQPDWARLYDESGLTDTAFEGKDAFVAYMTALVGNDSLTWEEIPNPPEDQHLYRICIRGQQIGSFTLANQAKPQALIPDWKLEEISLQPERNQSVTVVKLEGHTAYVNGQALDDSYTTEVLSTTAESYLPMGTRGVRLMRQEVSGLMLPPEVTVLDEEGVEIPLDYDAETGVYTEILPEAEPITKTLADRAVAAGEAYCGFLANKGTGLLSKFFAPGSQAYRQITALPRWSEWQPDVECFDQKLSEYTRYTEDLFSVRVSMTAELSWRYDPDPFDNEDDPSQFPMKTETYSMDTVFFFENRKNGWMVTGMTNDDTTIPTSRIRLTFLYDGICLSSAFYDSTDQEIYAPLIATTDGQILAGWANQDRSVIYTCNENGMLEIPEGTVLSPMILYPVFE